MENISPAEQEIIGKLHLAGRGIVVTAHTPQKSGGCHPFIFLRGVFPNETYDEAFQRIKPDVLQHISSQCGRPCQCNAGKSIIGYRIFGN